MVNDNHVAVLVYRKGIVSRSGYFIVEIRAGQQGVIGFYPGSRIQQIRSLLCRQQAHAVLGACSRSGERQVNLAVVLKHRRSFIYCSSYVFPAVLRSGDHAAGTGKLCRIRGINGGDVDAGNTCLGKVCPCQIALSARLKIGHIQRHGVQAVFLITGHRLHPHGIFPGIRIGNMVRIRTSHHEGTKGSEPVAAVGSRRTDNVPVIPDLVKFRSPDPLAVGIALAIVPRLIPDHGFLRGRKALNGGRLPDHQAVISIRSAGSVCGIRSGKVIHTPLRVIGHKRIGSFLNQRFFRIRVGDGALYLAPHFIGARGGCIHILQVFLVPNNTQLLGGAVRVLRGNHFRKRILLVLADLNVRRRLHACVGNRGEFLHQRVILRLGQSSYTGMHRVCRRSLNSIKFVLADCRRLRCHKIRAFRLPYGSAGVLNKDLVNLIRAVIYAVYFADAGHPRYRHQSLPGIGNQVFGREENQISVAAAVGSHCAEAAVSFAENLRRAEGSGSFGGVKDGLVAVQNLKSIFRLSGNLHAAVLSRSRSVADVGHYIRSLCHNGQGEFLCLAGRRAFQADLGSQCNCLIFALRSCNFRGISIDGNGRIAGSPGHGSLSCRLRQREVRGNKSRVEAQTFRVNQNVFIRIFRKDGNRKCL